MNKNSKFKTHYASPLGIIELTASERGVFSLYFVKKATGKNSENKVLKDCKKQLDEYFNRKRIEFALPLDMEGTAFQKKVWSELLKIPFGKTISYLELAKRVGDRNSIRAVGGANGKNPVSVIVPCHRVIGSTGKLIGYVGGIEKKRWLLDFESEATTPKLF